MHFTSLALAALLSVAQAVDVQVVYVGKNPANNATGNKFWPSNIKAKAGTMVQFQFWDGNHTASQSSFDSPCTPMEASAASAGESKGNSTASAGGVKSGFQPVDASMPNGKIPVWTLMINDTSPLWFYCAQGTHCQGGMSMVINEDAASGKTLAKYQTQAAALDGDSSGSGGGGGKGSADGSKSAPSNGSGNGDEPKAAASSLVFPSTMMVAMGASLLLF